VIYLVVVHRMLPGIKQRTEMLAPGQVRSWIPFGGGIDAVERAAMGVTNKLQRAILLIQSGDKREGGRLLAEVLQANSQNETAWFWMSGVVTTDEQRIDCLQRVVRINPENHVAREALIALRGKRTSPTESAPGGRLPAEATGNQKTGFGPVEPLEAIPRPAPPFQTLDEGEQTIQPELSPDTGSTSEGAGEEPPESGTAPPSETPPPSPGGEETRFTTLQALILPLIALSAIIVSTLLCYGTAQEIVGGAVPDSTGPRAFWRFFFSWLLTLLGPMGIIIVGVLAAVVVAMWALSRIIRAPITMIPDPVGQQAPSAARLDPAFIPSATHMQTQEQPGLSVGTQESGLWSVRTLLIAAILAVLILAVAACATLFLENSYAAPGLVEGSDVAPFLHLYQRLAIQ
jgi:uncharacterized membrane protein